MHDILHPALDHPSAPRANGWFALSVCTLAVMAACVPLIARSALAVLRVESATALEWVPREFGPRQAYEAFVQEFESGDVVILSWPGCEVGSPALEQIVSEASGARAPRDSAGRPWFDAVATGSTALERLTRPPLALEYQAAVERLRGVLIGPDGRTTCAVVGFTPAGLADRRSALRWITETAVKTGVVEAAELRMAGPVVDNVSVDEASNGSFETFAAPAAVVVLLLTWWSLRSFSYACLVFALSLWCVGLSYTTLHLCGDRMNPVLIIMPVLVLVLGVSGGIHLLNYLVEAIASGGKTGVATRAVRIGWLPCLLSAGTTAIGLFSLVLSELEPIRTFGLHGSIAVMATLACMFLVLPGIFERWPIPRRSAVVGAAMRGREDPYAAAVIRHAPAVVIVFFAAMVAAAAGIPGIRSSVRIDTLFSPDSKVLRDYAWIEEHIGPLVPIEVVLGFAASSPVQPAERLAILERVGDRLATTTSSDTVMSAALFLRDEPRGSGPFAAARRRITARRLAESLVASDDMKYIRARDGSELWRVTARISALRDVDYGKLLDLVRDDVRPIVEEAGGVGRGITAECTGVMPLVHAIQNTLLADLFKSFLSACGLITLVMMVVERGWAAGLIAMVSNVFPMILLFGLLGWSQTPLDIGSVMTASIALGMAIDGTLHFLTFYRRSIDAGLAPAAAVQAAFGHCAAAMTQSTVVCGLGILTFSASSFAPTSRFAVMLAVLLAAALAGDLLLLPAMLVGPLGRCFTRRGGRFVPVRSA